MKTNKYISDLRQIACPCTEAKDEVVINLQNDYIPVTNYRENIFPYQPLLAIIEITNNCNLHCKHCCIVERRNKDGLSLSVFEQILKTGIINFELTGGEPLTHPRFSELIQLLQNKGCYYRLISNGTLWTEKIFTELSNYQNCEILISIDGGEETHDYIRGKGVYKKAIRTLEVLKSNKINSGISITISKKNLNEINHIISIANKINVNILKLIPLKNNTLDKEFGRLYVPTEKEINDVYIKLKKGLNQNIEIEFNSRYITVQNNNPVYFGCKMGTIACSIDSYGYMQKCPVDRTIIGKIENKNFLELWKQLQIEIRSELYTEECYKCVLKNNCSGKCRYDN